MKLFYNNRSPYVRKVRVLALEKNIQLELIKVDLKNKPKELLAVNPLGQIPTLVLDNGAAIYDSVVITEYLDSLNERPRFIPASGKERFDVLKLAALGDGIMDYAIEIVHENFRPEEKQIDENRKKRIADISRCLQVLEYEVGFLRGRFSLAQIAVGCALGYLDFRLPDLEWQEDFMELADWYDGFSTRPSMKETKASE